MLWHPQDAEDATQEILVKIVTHLGNFRQESAFTTWYYRIAANHLLTARKRRAELFELTFEKLEDEIDRGMEYSRTHSTPEPEQDLLAKEVMVGCVQGVMLCLDRELRITYILGEVYDVNSHIGADVLDITPEAFRKRLSRARTLMRDFLAKNCGLVDTSNPCACSRQIPYSTKTGLVNPKRLLFAEHPCRPKEDATPSEPFCDTDEFSRVAALLRGPEYAAPNGFVERVRALIDSGGIEALQRRH
jgi:RNA polymerase sigma factor (sigma-70 family)